MTGTATVREVRAAALHALSIAGAAARCSAVDSLMELADVDPDRNLTAGFTAPARPDRPRLVAAGHVPRRSPQTVAGRAALLHSLAHIEFNAVALALDAVWRFSGMPRDYYLDWCRVAHDEARHFRLLDGHLATLGYAYGDFDAHGSLWEAAERTSHDVLDRIAIVPRTLEARGLDASPRVREALAAAGDESASGILDIILADEIRHVAIGNRWFNWLCAQRGRNPLEVQTEVEARYRLPVPRGPLNVAARRAAGFSDGEIRRLEGLIANPRQMTPD